MHAGPNRRLARKLAPCDRLSARRLRERRPFRSIAQMLRRPRARTCPPFSCRTPAAAGWAGPAFSLRGVFANSRQLVRQFESTPLATLRSVMTQILSDKQLRRLVRLIGRPSARRWLEILGRRQSTAASPRSRQKKGRPRRRAGENPRDEPAVGALNVQAGWPVWKRSRVAADGFERRVAWPPESGAR
jgi:hypothetical protein